MSNCQRCGRDLVDPKAQYGWRCIDKVGIPYGNGGGKGISLKVNFPKTKTKTTTPRNGEAVWKIIEIGLGVGLEIGVIVAIIAAISGSVATTGPGGVAVGIVSAVKLVDSTVRASRGFTLLLLAILYTIFNGGFDYTETTIEGAPEVIDWIVNLPVVTPPSQ